MVATCRLAPRSPYSLAQAASALRQQARFRTDLSVHANTGRESVGKGPGGRSSNTGSIATVFGCTGFLGRYIVAKLAKQGTQVVVPYRDEDDKRHLRVTGDLGQIVPLEWNLRNDLAIEEAVRHSDVVFNLTSRSYETKNFSYTDVNVEGARRIARIAYDAGVSRFIHLSHLNADHDSKSYLYRSKAEGEEAVREAFPDATIVRPGPLFGHEDKLLNSIATKPRFWRVNGQETTMRPVHSLDVAEACKLAAYANSTIGSTISLGGPKTYTYEQLIALVELHTMLKLQGNNVPIGLLKMASAAWQNIWWPTSCPDDFTRKTISDYPDAPGTLGFGDLDIEPAKLEDVANIYLRRYRPAVYFDAPAPGGGLRLTKGKYHVVQ